MSHTGKLTRGLKWSTFANNEGNFPEEIRRDANKLKDIKYYKEFIDGADKKLIDKKICELYELRHNWINNTRSSSEMFAVKDMLGDKNNFISKTNKSKKSIKGKGE